jgi:hypothetical protein
MSVSWFGWGAVSSSRPAHARAARAAAVKDGRRSPPKAARSVLDRGEHGAMLTAGSAKRPIESTFSLDRKGERSMHPTHGGASGWAGRTGSRQLIGRRSVARCDARGECTTRVSPNQPSGQCHGSLPDRVGRPRQQKPHAPWRGGALPPTWPPQPRDWRAAATAAHQCLADDANHHRAHRVLRIGPVAKVARRDRPPGDA